MVHTAAVQNMLLGKKPSAIQAQTMRRILYLQESKEVNGEKKKVYKIDYMFLGFLLYGSSGETMRMLGYRVTENSRSLPDSKQVIKNP